MKQSHLFFCFFIISALTLFAFSQNSGAAEYVPGEILVKFKDNVNTVNKNYLHANINSVKKRSFKKIKVHHIKLPNNMNVEEAVKYYQQDPGVEYAEPNYIVRATATTPDDTSFGSLWGLQKIDAPEAWDTVTGSEDVIIAVIDTGVAYNHPDFYDPGDLSINNIWTNTGEDLPDCDNGLDDDGNGYIDDCNGWDFLNDDNDPTDYSGHGTHVAGTIAAYGNNSLGITGVMWRAKIMPVRFLGIDGYGSTADAVSAILYASENGAHVINNSWSGSGYSQALKDAIDASDAVVVCAAGNSSRNIDSISEYPAGYSSSNIISVAATDSSDNLAGFSNFGASGVDLAAPGVSIYSSIPEFSFGAPDIVYSENFDTDTGPLPEFGSSSYLLGWQKNDAVDSKWEVTEGTGKTGNSLEDSPFSADYFNNSAPWTGYMTPINTEEKDYLYTFTFQWKGSLLSDDHLYIIYSVNGLRWYAVDDINGTQYNFASYSTDRFTVIAEAYDSFYLGFGMITDNSGVADGVYLDDIEVIRKKITISNYDYTNYSGTSMAAPHVSGVAGLILSQNSALTNIQVINMILDNVDKTSSLSGKVDTGGRLNAANAIQAPPGDTTRNSDDDPPPSNSGGGGGGGSSGGGPCFIATAAYGSILHPHVKALRDFRDRYLLNNFTGRAFVRQYYKYSPPAADFIKKHGSLRFITRVLLTPLVMLVVFPYISLFLSALISVTALFIFKRYRPKSNMFTGSGFF